MQCKNWSNNFAKFKQFLLFRIYAKEIPALRRFTYDPFTQTVNELSAKERVQQEIDQLTSRVQILKDEISDPKLFRAIH